MFWKGKLVSGRGQVYIASTKAFIHLQIACIVEGLQGSTYHRVMSIECDASASASPNTLVLATLKSAF